MKTIIFCTIILANLIYACDNSYINESEIIRDKVKNIQVKAPYDNILQIDSIFSSIEAIRLETNSQCPISHVRKVLFHNNHIYVSNEAKNLFVFSNNGKFSLEISKKGRGPEEFFELRDFQIDNNGNIHILDYQKILVFSNDGSLIDRINFALPDESVFCNPIGFALSEKKGDYYLWGGSFGIRRNPKNNHFALYRIDKSGNFTEKYFPVKHSIMGNSNRFRNFKSITNIAPVFGNDTIFSIENGLLKARYSINFGNRSLKEKIPENYVSLGEFKIRANKKNVTGIHNFIETSNWCYFNFSFNQLVYNAFYSKFDNKVYVSKFNPRLPDRIAPFTIHANNGDKMIAVKNADFIVREVDRLMVNSSILSNDEKNFISTLAEVKETDNPVLLVCKLRNETERYKDVIN